MIKDANGKNVFKIKMRGKSFALNLLEKEQVALSQENNVTALWHKRLGHFHHNGVFYMKKNQLAIGLPNLKQNLPTCIACQYGKQSRLPFPRKSTRRSSHKLQLVHTDVGGPQRTPSLKDSKYYIAFIDDYTKYYWIFFLNFKSKVADVFWKYKALVENQSGVVV